MPTTEEKIRARFCLLSALNVTTTDKVKYFKDWLHTFSGRYCAYSETPTHEQKIKLTKARADFMRGVKKVPDRESARS